MSSSVGAGERWRSGLLLVPITTSHRSTVVRNSRQKRAGPDDVAMPVLKVMVSRAVRGMEIGVDGVSNLDPVGLMISAVNAPGVRPHGQDLRLWLMANGAGMAATTQRSPPYFDNLDKVPSTRYCSSSWWRKLSR